MSTTTIVIIAAVFLAGLTSGALIIWWALRRKISVSPGTSPPLTQFASVKKEVVSNTQASPLIFRWSYVMAPMGLGALCLVLAASFAAFLPTTLGFRFMSDGTIRMSMNAYTFIVLMLAAQVVCVLAAWGIAGTIIRLGRSAFKTGAPQVPLGGYISLMTNMTLLPQLILAYVMLDSFIYGVWARHVISLGLFSILTIAIGSLILIFMFIRLLSRANSVMNKQ